MKIFLENSVRAGAFTGDISPRARWNVLFCPDTDDGGVRQGAGGVKDKVWRKRVPRKL